MSKLTSWENSNNNSLIVSPEVSLDAQTVAINNATVLFEERKYRSTMPVQFHNLSQIDDYDVNKNICTKNNER